MHDDADGALEFTGLIGNCFDKDGVESEGSCSLVVWSFIYRLEVRTIPPSCFETAASFKIFDSPSRAQTVQSTVKTVIRYITDWI